MNVKIDFNTRLSLDKAVTDFLNTKRAERLSRLTIRSYDGILRNFIAFEGGGKNLEGISVSDIRAYLGSREDISAKTLYNYHTCLSSLWGWAVENEYAGENIIRRINPPKYISRRIVPYTYREIDLILKAARRTRDRAIVMLLIDCGVRASEIVNLRVEDWHPGALKVLGKGAKERLVPISEPTEKMISLQLRARRVGDEGIQGGEALFANIINSDPISYSTLENLMIRLEKRSGVHDVHCHRFRHTFAISYLRNGGDIYTLQKILGHSTLDMCQNYLDIVRTDIIAAHAKASPVVVWGLGKD